MFPLQVITQTAEFSMLVNTLARRYFTDGWKVLERSCKVLWCSGESLTETHVEKQVDRRIQENRRSGQPVLKSSSSTKSSGG